MTKVDEILANICDGIDIPEAIDQSQNHVAERLIEQVESNAYPYPPITCNHLEEKGLGEDCVECQQKQYETYKSRFLALTEEKGLAHTHTLKAAFDYYSTLITRYFLTECDALLEKVYPVCEARGTWSSYYIMAIQALAFLRFKQSRYEESLDYFHKQIDALGPNEVVYENMALAYSRLDEQKEACVCYAKALLMIRKRPAEKQKFPTLLMGLATVLDKSEDSLVVLEESMRLLKERYDKPHSLMAKTLTAMGDLHIKLQNFAAAEECFREGAQIMLETCGEDTPLTSNAMSKHASALLLVNRPDEALQVFLNALNVWTKVDELSFDPNRVVEAILFLKDQQSLSTDAIQIIEILERRIVDNQTLNSHLNTLCLLKFIYELYIMNQAFLKAERCCEDFARLLQNLNRDELGEFVVQRDGLLEEANMISELLRSMSP